MNMGFISNIIRCSPIFCKTVLELSDVSIDRCDGADVHHVAHGSIEVGEMDGLVESHLNRADDFNVVLSS